MSQEFQNDDIKITDLIRSFSKYSRYVLRKWWVLCLFGFGFAALGYLYAHLSKTNYTANTAFNVVDSKGKGGMGSLLSLANSFGFSMGSGSYSNEVLAGIMQSRNVVKSALLSEIVRSDSTREKLGNRYLDIYGFTEDYEKDPKLSGFRFEANDIYELTRREDSVMSGIYNAFMEDNFEIEFDALSGLLRAKVKSLDYNLSLVMCERMLQYSSNFYIRKQIEGQMKSLEMLNKKMDSVNRVLIYKEKELAKQMDRSSYSVRQEENVAQDKLLREVGTLNLMYSQTSMAQDGAITGLQNETPVINVVDEPRYSMEIVRKKKLFWMIIGGLIGGVLGIFFLLFRKAARDAFEEEKAIVYQN